MKNIKNSTAIVGLVPLILCFFFFFCKKKHYAGMCLISVYFYFRNMEYKFFSNLKKLVQSRPGVSSFSSVILTCEVKDFPSRFSLQSLFQTTFLSVITLLFKINTPLNFDSIWKAEAFFCGKIGRGWLTPICESRLFHLSRTAWETN